MCDNNDKYSEIKEWISYQILLKKQDKNQRISLDNFIFIAGNTGIGKTYSIQKICKELNLHVINLTTHNCSSSFELRDNFIKCTTSSMLQVLTNDSKDRIIVIDEFEAMMSMDRTMNSTLLSILTDNKLKMLPVVCILSLDIFKKLGALKKKCRIIELCDISESEILSILTSKYPDKNNKYLLKIAKESQYNITQSCQKIENKSCNKNDNIDDILNINMLYGQMFNRQKFIQILMMDPLLIPLRYHENLITELQNRKITIKMRKDYYKYFMDNMIFFDILLCNNNINIALGLFPSLIYPLSKMPMKKGKESSIAGFTKILSYLSLQKKYAKKSYSSNFPLYQISNYHINIVGRNYIFFN